MKKLGWSVLLGFALVRGAVGAVPTPAGAINFEYREGLIWVQAQTSQSSRPLNFLFDTGAEESVLNAATVKELGLKGGKTIPVQGVDTVTTGQWPVAMKAKAGNLALPEKYLSLDLSQLASTCERPLDGLLGADFIRGKVVQIDFQAHQIRFLDKAAAAKTDIELPLKSSGKCLCAPVRINGGDQQWLRIDTGCATPLQWVTGDTGLAIDSTRPAIGLTGLAVPQTRATVAIGSQTFEQVPAGLHSHAIFAGESGLLGNALLTRFKTVTLDTRKARMILTPP